MRLLKRLRAFSMTETMVSSLVATVVVVGSVGIFNQLNKKNLIAQIQIEWVQQAKTIESMMRRDMESAIRFSDYWGLMAFGLYLTDFENEIRMSDVVSMYVRDNIHSEAASWKVTSITEDPDTKNWILGVNFSEGPSLKPVRSELIWPDFFAFTRGSETLVIQPDMVSLISDRWSNPYQFVVSEDTPLPLEWVNASDYLEDLPISRASHVFYLVGSSGLFRGGGLGESHRQLARDVHSLRVKLWFSDINGPAEEACENYNQSQRNFNLVDVFDETEFAPCSWNHLETIRVEMVFVSKTKDGFEPTPHPHYGYSDRRLKYVHSFSVSPRSYRIWRESFLVSSLESDGDENLDQTLSRPETRPKNTKIDNYHLTLKDNPNILNLLSKDGTLDIGTGVGMGGGSGGAGNTGATQF